MHVILVVDMAWMASESLCNACGSKHACQFQQAWQMTTMRAAMAANGLLTPMYGLCKSKALPYS